MFHEKKNKPLDRDTILWYNWSVNAKNEENNGV